MVLATGRPFLLAVATLNGITGLAAVWILAPLSLGSDAGLFRGGAAGILAGTYADGFYYAPLFGLIATPLTWLPKGGELIVMTGLGLALLLVGLVVETRGLACLDRVLIGIAVLGFLPVVYELLIGQVTVLLAAAIYPVRVADGWRRGIALGLVLGLIPKPMLAFVLLWMLIWRRRALAATVLVAVAVTLVGIILLGPGIHLAWLHALVGTGQTTRTGNVAVTGLTPPIVALLLAVVLVALGGVTLLAERSAAFVVALLLGLLVVPFTLMYAVSILLLAVRPAAAVAPRSTRGLVLVANIAVIACFQAWAAAAIALVTLAAIHRRGSGPSQNGPTVPVTGRTTSA